MLHNGLYEQIINTALDQLLASDGSCSQVESIDGEEAAKVLA